MAGKIKWGVIGSGGIARRRTIPEGIVAGDNCELGAVFDVNAQANAEVAKEFGADHVIDASQENVLESVQEIAPGGADVVFECTGLPQCIDPSVSLCKLHGSFVWQGNYGAGSVPFNFLNPHGRQLTMYFPSDDGLWPCRRAVLRSMASGALQWERLITHRINYLQAPETFQQINEGSLDVLGLTINWEPDTSL